MPGTGSRPEGNSGHEPVVLAKWVRFPAVADPRPAQDDELLSRTDQALRDACCLRRIRRRPSGAAECAFTG
jgi:hypothetical protein